MEIIVKTQVIPQNGETKEIAIKFNVDDLARIVKEQGLEQGNAALDKVVSNYTQDVKRIISEVINK